MYNNIKAIVNKVANGKTLATLFIGAELEMVGVAPLYFDDDSSSRRQQEKGRGGRFKQKPAIVVNPCGLTDGSEVKIRVVLIQPAFILVQVIEVTEDGDKIQASLATSENITDWQRSAIDNFLAAARRCNPEKLTHIFGLSEDVIDKVLNNYATASLWERSVVDSYLIKELIKINKVDAAAMLLPTSGKQRMRAIAAL